VVGHEEVCDPIRALHDELERTPTFAYPIYVLSPAQYLEAAAVLADWDGDVPFAVVSAMRGIARAAHRGRLVGRPAPSLTEAVRAACRSMPDSESLEKHVIALIRGGAS